MPAWSGRLLGLGRSVLRAGNGLAAGLLSASDAAQPGALASAPETERLQTHDASGVLGFNWGIDPASPEQVHEAQAGMEHRPPPAGPRRPRRFGRRPSHHLSLLSKERVDSCWQMPD